MGVWRLPKIDLPSLVQERGSAPERVFLARPGDSLDEPQPTRAFLRHLFRWRSSEYFWRRQVTRLGFWLLDHGLKGTWYETAVKDGPDWPYSTRWYGRHIPRGSSRPVRTGSAIHARARAFKEER